MKSNLYSNIFEKILFEDNFAGDGGALGTSAEPIYSPDNIRSGDRYASGDSRNIFGNFKPIIQRRSGAIRGGLKKKRKKRKKRR